MLVDGQIRQKVVLLGDAVADDVEAALAEVVRGASIRDRRTLVTRTALVVVVTTMVVGLWFGSVWSYERPRPQQPVQETTEWDQPAPRLRERLRFQDDRSAGARESKRRSGGDARRFRSEARTRRMTSISSGSTSAAPARSEFKDLTTRDSETRRPGGNSPQGGFSRAETAPYQMPLVRPRIDHRQSCSVFGEGCVGFDTRPTEDFVQVTVADDSGEPVLVRITQWDRHGRTVGDPTLYCGGTSPKLEILPTTDHVEVEIDERNCPDGRQSRPVGGVVDLVFFHG